MLWPTTTSYLLLQMLLLLLQQSNDSFNFPLGLIKYVVIVTVVMIVTSYHKWFTNL